MSAQDMVDDLAREVNLTTAFNGAIPQPYGVFKTGFDSNSNADPYAKEAFEAITKHRNPMFTLFDFELRSLPNYEWNTLFEREEVRIR